MTEVEFPVKFSNVEDMYRHGNMRNQVGGGSGGLRTQLQDPGDPYPDELTSESYFVFVHGFNVGGQVARGWHAEIFKRLHQLGSRARFVGISWHGDVSPDYHKAVKHAFKTSENLAAWLQFGEDAEITIAAHSLGNVLVSNAIEHEGLEVERYYMINAASPIEAYDASQTTGVEPETLDPVVMAPRMTENEWKPYDRKLFASDWHKLFPAEDGRNQKLTWADRFGDEVPKVAYNFYSTGEDVVENADPTESFLGNVLWYGFVRHAWVQQEVGKGNGVAETLALKDTHAGWDFFYVPPSLIDPLGSNQGYWKADSVILNTYRKFTPQEAAALTKEQLKVKPFHTPFKFDQLYDPNEGSAEALKKEVQYDLLSAAIPAMSYAAAANSVDLLNPDQGMNRNFNMMNYKQGSWPDERDEGKWRHSDFRDVAMSYTWRMYEEMINQGKLNQ